MILLLYGSDTYRSQQKLQEIIEEYRKKSGGDFHPHTKSGDINLEANRNAHFGVGVNLHRIDAETEGLEYLKSATDATSLFSAKKLIVVENAFLAKKDVEVLASVVPKAARAEDTIVVLWEKELNEEGRKKLEKYGKYFDKTYEFKPLAGPHLRSWILNEARKRDLRLSPQEMSEFEILGGDLWELSNILDRVAVSGKVASGRVPASEENIFHLGDTFFTSRNSALKTLLNLIRKGEDEVGIFSYLVSHARQILAVQHFWERKKAVPASQGIHPFVVKKITALAPRISSGEIRRIMGRFFEEDRKIKTGRSTPKDSLINILVSRQER